MLSANFLDKVEGDDIMNPNEDVRHLVPAKNCTCSIEAPLLQQIKFCNDCPGKCEFCIDHGNRNPRTMDIPAMVKASIEATDFQVVDVTGGEPLLHFDKLISLLEGIRPHKQKIILNTNGCFLTPEKVARLNGLVDELRIALHHYKESLNAETIGLPIRFDNIRNALEEKQFETTFNRVVTQKWIGDDHFVEKLIELCHEIHIDGCRISEVKYIGLNHGHEEYDKNWVALYPFFEKFSLIEPKNSTQLIQTGCIDIVNFDGVKFHLKRLCGYKLEESLFYPHPTFMVIYSDGLTAPNWIYADFN